VDAREPPHVLVFQVAPVAEPENPADLGFCGSGSRVYASASSRRRSKKPLRFADLGLKVWGFIQGAWVLHPKTFMGPKRNSRQLGVELVSPEGQGVCATGLDKVCDVKLGREPRVLRVANRLAVDPEVESTRNAFKVDDDALAYPL